MSATNEVIDIPDDLSELCRVCLQIPEENNCLDLSLIYDEEDNLTYGECFTICTKIHLNESDNLPHNLCKTCGLELQMSYDFYKKVEESNQTIKQYQQKIEEVTKQLEGNLVETERHENKESVDDSVANYAIAADVNGDDNGIIKSSTMYVESLFQTFDSLENDGRDIKDSSLADTSLFTNNIEKSEDVEDQGSIDQQLQENNHEDATNTGTGNVECLSQEEHLDCDDFNFVEALDDDETQQSKFTPADSGQIILHMDDSGKYFIDTGNICDQQQHEYTTVTLQNEELEETSQDSQDSQEDLAEDANRSWQENVVTVANKEHIPLEMENDEMPAMEDDTEEFAYELIDNDEGANDDGNGLIDMINNDKESNGSSNLNSSTILQSRKRHFGSFACDFCHKVYPNYSRMITHRRCHEKDRPKYPCEHCGRIYATKQAMECHVQTFHEKTGFVCNICQKIFPIRRSLEVHMRFHTGDFPYACNLCDKKFAQRGHLNTHKNVRHNNVRFGCNYPDCGKFFTSSTSLRNHEFSHGAMPFECHYCQRGYPAKAKLKVHVKRKHNIELSKEQLEEMRKFHVVRSKVNLVKVVPIEDEEEEEEEEL
ncbi:uncharacterized protein [Musca autumnalis]|uniref:uncharacterized protein n=1 Tax=Musca autumnalis TaxID=221902 RepID=UPI003CEA0F51